METHPLILVLGIGFGHHIEALQEALLKIHGSSFHLAIIDPCKDVFDDFLKQNPSCNNNTGNITYHIDDNIDALYKKDTMIQFLQKGPGLIAHTPSFNLYNDFFKEFISYQAPTSIHEYVDQLNDKNLKQHLSTTLYEKTTNLSEYTKNLDRQARELKKYDYLLLALREIQNEKHINH